MKTTPPKLIEPDAAHTAQLERDIEASILPIRNHALEQWNLERMRAWTAFAAENAKTYNAPAAARQAEELLSIWESRFPKPE